ncbi:hypothetical protein CKAN_01005300 [Cinnamomum micranthum f. kanehirae]|uniref:Transmembrane protein n=1 Tax=Cinnamomum micranthum f. kanehirae TaxID=337451 RepID=A0A443NS89_9MAGN|nr:hypothetical protein CKAN_01005300 [Cinnamomum micranthum f. kanehirae]
MNEIFDWEQVPKPPPSTPPPPPTYDADCSIFPPRSHEGLNVQEFQLQPSKPTLPNGDVADRRPLPLSVSRLQVAGKSAKQRLLLGFQALYSKLLLLLRVDSLNFSSRRVVWSFPVAAAATSGVAGVLFLMWLKRRRVAPAEKDETVLLLIRENQKKIDQLLHEITQLKELMSLQHKVPVLRSICPMCSSA